MKWAAARTSAALSLLFLVVYHGCAWITAQRSAVGTFYFSWESWIPFVPVFILPYLSIDLFFTFAPFLCRDRRELEVFGRRITASILVAGICFLIMPLTLAVARPQPEGWLGALYLAFCKIDRPFNLFPSLHIAFRGLLGHLYARHTRGPLFWVVQVWFSLIGVSTLLTWQHHVIDVVGGFFLAALCFYFIRETPGPRFAVLPNRPAGLIYALGGALLVVVALLLPRTGLFLLWPAFSLGAVAAGYFGAGPAVYGKEDGRISFSARLLMWPCLLGQWLSLCYYRRQARPWDEVAPGLLVGRQLNAREAADAVRAGVSAVLDLTAEFSAPRPFREVVWRNLPILDLTAPGPGQLAEAVAFIGEQLERGTVYVHCKIGYSRSAAVAGAWLLASGRARTAQEAMAQLRAARPSMVIRPEAEAALKGFERRPGAEVSFSASV